MEEIKPDLPILDNEVYTLLRKYFNGSISAEENESLQEKIKHLSTLDALKISFQFKNQYEIFLQIQSDH